MQMEGVQEFSKKMSSPKQATFAVLMIMVLFGSSKAQNLNEVGDTLILMTIVDTLDNLSLQIQEQERNLQGKIKEMLEEQERNLQAKMEEMFEEQERNLQARMEEMIEVERQLENSLQHCSTKTQVSEFQDLLVTDECMAGSHNCSQAATCTDSPIQYKCACLPGYSGDGFTCQDVDECLGGKNLSCSVNEMCINNLGSYICICPEGFEKEADICKDVDECLENNATCGSTEVCINNLGSYICICPEGLVKEGNICQDVDECLENNATCGSTEVCFNNLGSYICICPEGLVKEGNICRDVDECLENNATCGSTEVCINNLGSYICICPEGLVKDGNICQENPVCELPHLLLPSLGCISFVNDRLSWDDGKAKCQELGGRLLEGIKKEHLKALNQHFYPMMDDFWTPWVGLRDGRWLTSGKEVRQEDWRRGEPGGVDEACGLVALHPSDSGVADYLCDSLRNIMCQSIP